MFRLFNSILLSCFFACSSTLCAAIVQFPINKPVLQSGFTEYSRITDNKKTKIFENLNTLLSIKNISYYSMGVEVIYLDIFRTHFHDNLNYCGDRIDEQFDSTNPQDMDLKNLDSWQQIVEQAHLINVTSANITSSEVDNFFYTYRNNFLYQGSLNVLLYIYGKDLNVGDSFKLNAQAQGTQFTQKDIQLEYTITDINDKNVSYKVKVTGALNGLGVGFWKRENGLIGQLEYYLYDNINVWKFLIQSTP